MKLVFLSDGLAEHTRRWTRFFAAAGHEVHLVTLNPAVLPDYDPVVVHVLSKRFTKSNLVSRLLNVPSLLKRMRSLTYQIRPDVIHAHSVGAYSVLAMLSGNRPYVVTPWGSDVLIDMDTSLLARLIGRRTLAKASLVTTDAYHVHDRLVQFGIPESRIKLIVFGVDRTRFHPNRKTAVLREQWDFGDAPVVISTRTLNPIHDVSTLVKSVPLVRGEVPNVKVVVASDGAERDHLHNLARSLQVEEAVSFIGYLTEDEMADWLNVADVYVSTSLSDAGLAGSTAEAMACALPVVVTDNADNSRWVMEGQGGFLVPNGDLTALAQRVVDLLKSESLRRSFGFFNQSLIAERNDYLTEMKKMEDLYLQLSSNAGRDSS